MANPRKMVISPGQGLLILIDYYKNDIIKVERLKKLYLCGAENNDEIKEIKTLLGDAALNHYEISFSPQTINNDRTRRYFETHLAYETLKNGLSQLDKTELEGYFSALKNKIPVAKLRTVERVLSGELKPDDTGAVKEYAHYIQKIRAGELFAKLSSENKHKIELLVKCSFLGVANASYNDSLPLDIYGTGMYSNKNRGKIVAEEQSSTRSQHLGLMKGHMPLALDDMAHSDYEIPYLRASDQATFDEHALWVKAHFNKLVHPYSNSISGTVLCQLRSLAQLRNEGQGIFTQSAGKLEQYSQLMISTMLFTSGGHSFNEYVSPFLLPQVRNEFRSISDFDQISLESMYLTKNKRAFNAALEDAIDYNKSMLLRDQLCAKIKGSSAIPAVNKVQLNLKITQELNALSHLTECKKDAYQERVKNQWFSFFRSGVKKNSVIQQGLNAAIKHLDSGDFDKAKDAVSRLKIEIESKFGKTNFWGQKSESFKLVESLENQFKLTEQKTENYKQQSFDL